MAVRKGISGQNRVEIQQEFGKTAGRFMKKTEVIRIIAYGFSEESGSNPGGRRPAMSPRSSRGDMA